MTKVNCLYTQIVACLEVRALFVCPDQSMGSDYKYPRRVHILCLLGTFAVRVNELLDKILFNSVIIQ